MNSLESPDLDGNGNPSLRCIALGESLSGQLLGNFEQMEDLYGNVWSKKKRENFGVQ